MEWYKEDGTVTTTYVADVFRLRAIMNSEIDSLAEVGRILYYDCADGTVDVDTLDRIVRLLADAAEHDYEADDKAYKDAFNAGWNAALDEISIPDPR